MDIRSFFTRSGAARNVPAPGSATIEAGASIGPGATREPEADPEGEQRSPDRDMIVLLEGAFATGNAKETTASTLKAIEEAESESQLEVVAWVMDGYKANTPAPQKRRLLEWTPTTSTIVATPVLPKGMEKALAQKRRKLNDIPIESSEAPEDTAITSASAQVATSSSSTTASDFTLLSTMNPASTGDHREAAYAYDLAQDAARVAAAHNEGSELALDSMLQEAVASVIHLSVQGAGEGASGRVSDVSALSETVHSGSSDGQQAAVTHDGNTPGVVDHAAPSSQLTKYTKHDQRGPVTYIKQGQELFGEVNGVMYNLYGRSGKDLWNDMKNALARQPRSVRVNGMKGQKILIDRDTLREIVMMLPVMGTKTAALADIWEQLGGHSTECPSSHDTIADSRKLEALANIFQVQHDKILTLHRKHAVTAEEKAVLTINGSHKQLFALVDIAMMITKKDQNGAGQQVRNILKKFPEAFQYRVMKCSFGEGPRQWAADIYTAIRLIYKLDGGDAREMAEKSAMLWVQFWGGNTDIATGVMQNRVAQEQLAITDPDHPMRIFGEEAEAMQENVESRDIIQHVRHAYRPEEMSEYHDGQKERSVSIFTNALHDFLDPLEELSGSIVVLDDMNREGIPRTTKALLCAGVPCGKILIPNKDNQEVVDACVELGARSVRKRLERAMESDFREEQIVAAYIDGMCCDNYPLTGMIVQVLHNQIRAKPFVLGFTMVGRNFQEGGAEHLAVRLVKMWEILRMKGFEPIDTTFHNSCRVYRSTGNKQDIATCFAVRRP